MSNTLVSVVIATYNRRADLARAIESTLGQSYSNVEIVVVSNSDDGTNELFAEGARFDRPEITYLHDEERMGVAKARNVGYREASGDVVVTIDDDAEFQHENVLEELVSAFEADPDLGIVAFRIENAQTGEVETLPRRRKDRSPEESFEACYFIGAGNAIRSSVFEVVGYYPHSFRYGAEELDLAYRALDAGFAIRYLPEASVIHKESPEGRFADSTVRQYLVENRLRFVVRNLPWRYAIPYMTIWTLYGLYLSKLDPRPTVRAYRNFLSERRDLLEQREVISDETIQYLKRHSGRLLY